MQLNQILAISGYVVAVMFIIIVAVVVAIDVGRKAIPTQNVPATFVGSAILIASVGGVLVTFFGDVDR